MKNFILQQFQNPALCSVEQQAVVVTVLYIEQTLSIVAEDIPLCLTCINRTDKFNVHESVHRKYTAIYIQQDAALHSLFISGNCSTCFEWYLHPSSGAHTTIYSIWYLLHRSCYLPLSNSSTTAAGSSNGVTIPDAVDTVVCAPDDGWWYHPKHVEQFPDINKL
jgi:hypothetical protein